MQAKDIPITLNNRAVTLLQRGCCSREANDAFSQALSSVCQNSHTVCQSKWKQPLATDLANSVFSENRKSTLRFEGFFDQCSLSGKANRLSYLFDLKSMHISFSVIQIDQTLIDLLPPGEPTEVVITTIILYNWAVSCLDFARSQPVPIKEQGYRQALALLGKADELMEQITDRSLLCFGFELIYIQLSISYALWQAHRWSVGKRFLRSKTNMMLYQRYCRLVRKVQVLDKCITYQRQHIAAAAA
jgi:hypothetical protein